MKMPPDFAGAVPEFYFVAAVAVEERSEKVYNGNGFTLTRVMWGSRAFFAEERESVMTTMQSTPREVALAIPQRMAKCSFG